MHTLVDCYVSRQSLSKFKIGSPPHQLTTSKQRHLHTLMSLLLPSFTSVSFERQFLLLSCSHHFAPGNKARMQNCQASKLWQQFVRHTDHRALQAQHTALVVVTRGNSFPQLGLCQCSGLHRLQRSSFNNAFSASQTTLGWWTFF